MRHTKPIQEKISKAQVAVCGLGGLGSNIAIALARCGIGKLHLIDFDCVDLTNLNRQQYGIRQLGIPKPEALKAELLEINPYLEIATDWVKLTEENMKEILQENYICEAFDSPEAEYEKLAEQALKVCEIYGIKCILHTYIEAAIRHIFPFRRGKK